MFRQIKRFALAGSVFLAPVVAAAQQGDPGARQIRLVVGTDVGGSYDVTGRLMARHLGRFIPGNPTIIPQNMPGAAGLIAANYLWNVAPRDGSVIAIIPQVVLSQLFENKNVRFDAARFNWLGNPLGSASVTAVFHSSAVKTWRDALAIEASMGAPGPNSPDAFAVRIANATLGTKFKLISGYKGGNDISIAIERGEIDGRGSQTWAGWKATNPDWVASRKIVPLWQVSLTPDPELADVPLLSDLVQGPDNKSLVRSYSAINSLGRPFLAPPDVSPEIVAQLRKAFSETMKDPEFLADAERVGITVHSISGEALQTTMAQLLSMNADIRSKLRAVLGGE